jgi:hypothetical protein
MVGWCSMGTFNDPCRDLLPRHCQDCSLLGGRDCDAGTAFLQTKSAYRWTSLGAETEMAPMAPSFFQMGEEVPTTSNNLLNPEQVWAISNWVRCCGCRKVAHKLLDFWKTRDPQKRSKGSCIWLEKIMIVVDKVVAVERWKHWNISRPGCKQL